MKSLYYKLIYGIRNLFVWFKIVWKDRDWDDYFIYYLLRFKLNKMQKAFDKYSLHVSKERKVKQIKTVVALLDRLIENDYACVEYEKFNDVRYGGTKENRIFNWTENQPFTDEQTRLLDIASDKEYYMRRQDREMLFDILKKHIEEWWY